MGFVDLGSLDGNLYGVYWKTDVKSIVWYPIAGASPTTATRRRPPGTR